MTLAQFAKGRGLAVHMDGARFATAVAGLGVAPADLTWRAGVDVMSFGGTKNGCLAAEAVVFFDPSKAANFAIARQRAGQTFSKSWFLAAQFDAYLADSHWQDLARQANARAKALAKAIDASPAARLAVRPDGNELFAVVTKRTAEGLSSAGAVFHPWTTASLPAGSEPGPDEILIRLVTSFSTTEEDVERFASALAGVY
jgi:threonine aldolase